MYNIKYMIQLLVRETVKVNKLTLMYCIFMYFADFTHLYPFLQLATYFVFMQHWKIFYLKDLKSIIKINVFDIIYHKNYQYSIRLASHLCSYVHLILICLSSLCSVIILLPSCLFINSLELPHTRTHLQEVTKFASSA